MSEQHPDASDYVRLFERYGKDLGSAYREPDDERYALLFEQMIRLLIRPSAFNLSLPAPFLNTAHRYHDGNTATQEHMSDPSNRHFMLCDVHDLVMLKGGLALKRREARP